MLSQKVPKPKYYAINENCIELWNKDFGSNLNNNSEDNSLIPNISDKPLNMIEQMF